MDRSKQIVRTSIVGIAVNVVLVLFKMTVGLLSHSIAVILDAVNNLSDALSSVITIVGTKLAGRRPDKKHPYGYGRVEYVTGVAVAALVLVAGFTSFKESAVKVIHPEEASYSVISLVILAVAVLAKVLVGRYVKKVGTEIESSSLIASGSDALFDAVLSTATLIAALASYLWGLKLEGILGVVISVFIIKAGIEMLLETMGSIIGERTDSELAEKIKTTVTAYPGVRGAYDLSVHDYGPTQLIGSVHIEVNDNMTARELHYLTRRIAAEVYEKYGVILTLGVYAASDSSKELSEIRSAAEKLAAADGDVLQMHGFYGDEQQKIAMFDLIVDLSADAPAVRDRIAAALHGHFPDYRFDIVLDSDYSD